MLKAFFLLESEENMKRYDAIYARQSVDKKDSVSIEAQIEACKKKCDGDVLEYKDKGYSGKNTERPQLQKLLKDIEAGIIQKVVIYKIDRISRNVKDFHILADFLQSNNCDIVSATEPIDTTSIYGEAMMSMLAVFADLERKTIVARVKDNYYHRIKENRWASGKAPFGYKNGSVDGVKSLIPVPDEIKAVKWMYKTYSTKPSVSIGMLQKELIAKGIKPHESKNGFARSTILRILSNPVYAVADEHLYKYYQRRRVSFANSEAAWNGSYSAALVGKNNKSVRSKDMSFMTLYLTNTKGIINSNIFIMVQDRLAQNSQIASDNSAKNTLQELSGLIKCAKCGSAVTIHTRPTLTCNGKNQRRICNVSFAGLRLETIQDNVAVEVQNYLSVFQKKLAERYRHKEKEEKKIYDLQNKLNKLVDIAATSKTNPEALSKKMDAIQDEIYDRQLKIKLHYDARDLLELRTELNAFVVDKSGKANLDYAKLDTEKRQAVLRLLVDKILLENDGSVQMMWKEY